MYHISKVCIFHGRSAGTFRFYVKCILTEISAPELLKFFSWHTLTRGERAWKTVPGYRVENCVHFGLLPIWAYIKWLTIANNLFYWVFASRTRSYLHCWDGWKIEISDFVFVFDFVLGWKTAVKKGSVDHCRCQGQGVRYGDKSQMESVDPVTRLEP